MNEHYTHHKETTLREAMEVINRHLDGKAEGLPGDGQDTGVSSLLKELIAKVARIEESAHKSFTKPQEKEQGTNQYVS